MKDTTVIQRVRLVLGGLDRRRNQDPKDLILTISLILSPLSLFGRCVGN